MPETAEFDLTTQLAEFLRTHHFGKYRGLVSDVADPEALGRIKARVPAVFGADLETPWAMPAAPFAGADHGLFLLPEVGDGVWIEFEGGDPSRPIWSGCWWARGQVPSPAGEKQRLLATSAGHQILIDEDADEIRLTHPAGGELIIGASEITLTLGACELKITASEIVLNNGMVKVTTAGASLVNDALKVGA
jgi:uncharacterized protein involved in type VI secretion and phage assembly